MPICDPCKVPNHTPDQCEHGGDRGCPCQHRQPEQPTEAPTADPKGC